MRAIVFYQGYVLENKKKQRSPVFHILHFRFLPTEGGKDGAAGQTTHLGMNKLLFNLQSNFC